jgi:hypothetical protein
MCGGEARSDDYKPDPALIIPDIVWKSRASPVGSV